MSEPLASMTDEVSGMRLSLHRGSGVMPDYHVTTADGRGLNLTATEWVGLLTLVEKWLTLVEKWQEGS